MKSFDYYKLLNKYAQDIPGKEHTTLLTVNDIQNRDEYVTYDFENKKGNCSGLIIASKFNDNDELLITKAPWLHHTITIGSSGCGKTQGVALNTAFNAEGNISYIFTDPKGELAQASYNRMVEVYGEENVIVVNFMQPEFSMATINPFVPFALKWIEYSESNDEVGKKEVVTSIRKYVDTLFISKSQKDPTWEETAKSFLFGMIMALIEDLTLSEEEEKKFGRKKTIPEQINFDNLSKIFYSFEWDSRKFKDHGFLTKRTKSSLSYQNTKAVIENAQNTRSNYMQFVENYLKQYNSPKIQQISLGNTLDVESLADKPKVLYLIYDLSDISMREWVNTIIANILTVLLEKSHKTAKALSVPVLFFCDEFPTLTPNEVYPNILATGRGSKIYMNIVVQSYNQLEARYPTEHKAMKENCDFHIFLGTNDIVTAKEFIENLGKTTIADPEAFLMNEFRTKEIPVVSEDYLMHKMKKGEAFIKVHNRDPIHSFFELYYKVPNYTKYGEMAIAKKCNVIENNYTYEAEWLKEDCSEEDDDDDDLF